MSQARVKELLNELHQELQKNTQLSDEEATLLNQVLQDVSQMQSQDVDEDVIETLEKQAVIFSENHPMISTALTQVVNTLGRMGI